MPRTDPYAAMTESVIRALEDSEHDGKWERPWHAAQGPYNASTGLPYRGMNSLHLSIQGGFIREDVGAWATYKQWQSMGAQVQCGARSEIIISMFDANAGKGEINPVTNEPVKKLVATTARVFHHSQVEGWAPPARKAPGEVQSVEAIEDTIRQMDVEVRSGGSRAFYSISEDFINMPPKEAFFDSANNDRSATQGYYSTLLHELSHATGSESRLKRELTGNKYSASYAREELVAELGSLFLSQEFGVAQPNTIRDDHVQYVKGWLSALKSADGPSFLREASKEASRVVNYVSEHIPQRHREKLNILTLKDAQEKHEQRKEQVAARRKEAQEISDKGIEAMPPSAQMALRVAVRAPRVTHETKKGKILTGVVVKDPAFNAEHAKAVDPYSFRKDGGLFLREAGVKVALTALDRVRDMQISKSDLEIENEKQKSSSLEASL